MSQSSIPQSVLLQELATYYKLSSLDSSDIEEAGTNSGYYNPSLSLSSSSDSSITDQDSDLKRVSTHRYANLQLRSLRSEINQLQSKLQQATAVLDKERQLHLDQTSTLQGRITKLTTQNSSLQNEHNKVLKDLQTLSEKLQEPQNTNSISDIKSLITDLVIPESLYLEWRDIPPDNQSIRQYVCIRVYELLQIERIKQTATNNEASLLRAQLTRSEAEIERISQQLESTNRFKRTREHELTQEIAILSDKVQRLQTEATTHSIDMHTIITKAKQYDKIQQQLQQSEQLLNDLRQKDLMQTISIKAMIDEKNANAAKHAEDCKQVEILKLDKSYLTNQLESLQQRCQSLEKEKQYLQEKIGSLKKEKNELVEKVIRVGDEVKAEYERRYETELSALKKRTESELEHIRTESRASTEREIALLRESRDDYQTQFDTARLQLVTLQKNYDNSLSEFRTLQSTLDSERSQMKQTLTIKQYEYSRLTLTLEETMAEFRNLKRDYETVALKYDMVRKELDGWQQEHEGTINKMTEEMGQMKEKLEAYKQLEYELDVAVLSAGQEMSNQANPVPGVSNGIVPSSAKGLALILDSVTSNLPVSNKRRLQQSILLAQQLVDKTKDLNKLKMQLEESNASACTLRDRLTNAEKQLDILNQPQSYLIEQLRTQDDNVLKLKQELADVRKELFETNTKCESLLTELHQTRQDISTLLMQRSTLQNLRNALGQAKQVSNIPKPLKTDILNYNKVEVPIVKGINPGLSDFKNLEININEHNHIPPLWYRQLVNK